MELKIGSTEMVSFSLFKKRFIFESGSRGLVLESDRHGVCLYATDAEHGDIFAAMPLGKTRELQKLNYYFFAPDERKLLCALGRALFVMDFAGKWVSTNVEGFHVFGSDHWGQNCQKPWKGEYMRLFGLPDVTAEMDTVAAELFWQWFGHQEEKIVEKLSGSEAARVVAWVDEMLCPVFPYVSGDAVQFELGWNDGKGEIFFFHSDNEKLRADGEAFAAMMPEALKNRWTVIVRA